MQVNVINGKDFIMVQLAGDLDSRGAAEVKAFLESVFLITGNVPENLPTMMFDLSRVTSVSSSGIGLMASLQRIFNLASKKMIIFKPPCYLVNILKTANLTEIFNMTSDSGNII